MNLSLNGGYKFSFMKDKMKSVFNIVMFVFAIALLYSGCSRQTRQKKGLTLEEGTLTAGVEIGYPPMEYYDTDGKTLIGFDIELTKTLAEKLGLKIKYIDTSWDGILAGLDTNKYDIAINITILPERQKQYNFTRPYIDSYITIVALKESGLKIEKPEDIEGYNVCYQGDTTAQYFAERLSERGARFISYPYDKILNCFDDLMLGRVDFIVVDNIAAFNYVEKENSPFEIVWQEHSGENIGICLKKNNNALTDALNNALEELFENGIMSQISEKIFNRDLASSTGVFPH
jgi:polar amino acid transport system substrate-binding protein